MSSLLRLQYLSHQRAGMFSPVHYHLPVHQDIRDSGSVLVRILKVGLVLHRRRIEDHYIRRLSLF